MDEACWKYLIQYWSRTIGGKLANLGTIQIKDVPVDSKNVFLLPELMELGSSSKASDIVPFNKNEIDNFVATFQTDDDSTPQKGTYRGGMYRVAKSTIGHIEYAEVMLNTAFNKLLIGVIYQRGPSTKTYGPPSHRNTIINAYVFGVLWTHETDDSGYKISRMFEASAAYLANKPENLMLEEGEVYPIAIPADMVPLFAQAIERIDRSSLVYPILNGLKNKARPIKEILNRVGEIS